MGSTISKVPSGQPNTSTGNDFLEAAGILDEMQLDPSFWDQYKSQTIQEDEKVVAIDSTLNATNIPDLNIHPEEMNEHPADMNEQEANMDGRMNQHPTNINGQPADMNGHPVNMNVQPDGQTCEVKRELFKKFDNL
ncbi:hypothetical protein FRX31_020946 [Thalictrum thalictroides]|uniref:Uncharacterized protein n=1 Tax=Thalictrum thalictroides TaxID=46969 RepID=A0A7J6VY14_THATH|nr:hypothetical protein FRX31_020946 [Thalictrum thalictroides]